MIINWILRTTGLTIILALVLHFRTDLPFYLSWMGQLPGDEWLKDAGRKINFPVASAAIVSSLVSLILPSRR